MFCLGTLSVDCCVGNGRIRTLTDADLIIWVFSVCLLVPLIDFCRFVCLYCLVCLQNLKSYFYREPKSIIPG